MCIQYLKAFYQGNAYYCSLLGITHFDDQVKDMTRSSGLCHDANARYRPEAKVFPVEYDKVSVPEVWKTIEDVLAERGCTYEPGKHNDYICQAGYLLNAYGVELDEATEWMQRRFADYDANRTKSHIHSCYSAHPEEHGTLEPGKRPKATKRKKPAKPKAEQPKTKAADARVSDPEPEEEIAPPEKLEDLLAELDGYIGLAVSIFILISGVRMLKETIDPMLGSAPDAEEIERIRDKLLSYPGVLGMHDLMVHDYGPCRKFASVHIEMAAEEDVLISHDLIDNIEKDFLEEGLNIIIHYDPILTKDPITNDIRKQVETAVKGIDERLTIHDLRVVPGPTHTNLVFDCVKPLEVKIEDKELKRMIAERVKMIDSKYICVITVDQSYAPIIR